MAPRENTRQKEKEHKAELKIRKGTQAQTQEEVIEMTE